VIDSLAVPFVWIGLHCIAFENDNDVGDDFGVGCDEILYLCFFLFFCAAREYGRQVQFSLGLFSAKRGILLPSRFLRDCSHTLLY
jgi:hypothetical protein